VQWQCAVAVCSGSVQDEGGSTVVVLVRLRARSQAITAQRRAPASGSAPASPSGPQCLQGGQAGRHARWVQLLSAACRPLRQRVRSCCCCCCQCCACWGPRWTPNWCQLTFDKPAAAGAGRHAQTRVVNSNSAKMRREQAAAARTRCCGSAAQRPGPPWGVLKRPGVVSALAQEWRGTASCVASQQLRVR
jgi:hypothetical protein